MYKTTLRLAGVLAGVAIAAISVAGARASTVVIDGGVHYEGYLGVYAPGNAYNISLGGVNSGGAAVATTWGGSVYYGGANAGGALLNAEPWSLNVSRNGASQETALDVLVLDAKPLANNKYFGDSTFNQNGFGSTPAPKIANPEPATPQTILAVTRSGQYIDPATGAALTVAQSRELGGLYNYLETLTTPAALGAAQTYTASDATHLQFPSVNYEIAATQIAVWDVLGYKVALNGSSNLRPGGVNNGVDILNANGVNLVDQAETYASAHQGFAGVVVGEGANPSLLVTGSAVPEPAVWTMMITGVGAIGLMARRRRAGLTGLAFSAR